jgi:hypothetical protein
MITAARTVQNIAWVIQNLLQTTYIPTCSGVTMHGKGRNEGSNFAKGKYKVSKDL